jgi:hypothetical protein
MRRVAGSLVVLIASLAASPWACGAEADAGEYDFGESIVVFTLEYEDDLLPAPPWALANARVRRLGDVHFLTGTLPEAGRDADDGTPAADRYWIPLADVVRLMEFPDAESAREALRGPTDAPEGEVLHGKRPDSVRDSRNGAPASRRRSSRMVRFP